MKKELASIVDKELFNACKEGDIEKVKIALESGLSLDAQGEMGRSLLSISAEVCDWLIELLFLIFSFFFHMYM